MLDVVKKLALAVVFAIVVTSLVPATAASSSFAEFHADHGHDHDLLQSGGAPLSFLSNPDGFPARKNGNGQWHSGGTAVAHRAGGVPVTDAAITSKAPDGRFYRLGINGWEPTIGVDSKGRIFYQARHSNLEPHVVRSTNEGHTWKIVSPMIGPVPYQKASLDPILYLDKDTDRLFTNNIPPDITCQPVSFSDDAGESWTNTGVCGHFDHQNIFAGPPPEGGDQPSDYPNVVYYCAINLVMLSGTSTATTCARSLDGGLTWLPTGEPAYITPINTDNQGGEPWCDGAVGHGFVGEDGTVYLPRGWCGQPFLSISKDEGLTWDQVQVADNGANGHEAGVAADSKGNLYYTWIGGDDLPYLAISRDGGKKWSDPMMIGPPGIRRSSLPAIDIGGDGKIAMTYIGSETPGKQKKATWNGYITMTDDALAKDPLFYTGTMNSPSDPLHRGGGCGNTRCHSLGDFFDVTIGPDGTPWVAFVDACWESPKKCVPTFDAIGVRGEAVVGRLVGGPDLR